MPTKIIDNFSGYLSRQNIGDMSSGLARFSGGETIAGYNPFSNPTNLTWFEQPQLIDSGGTVITDLIMAMQPRLESGVTYVYAIGHTGRLYKIQVNNPSTSNPDYDNPVLLTTLTVNSPTFLYGASIQFYGATQKIYVGHDEGVTSVNFDGTGEQYIGLLGSWTQNVARPSANFLGVTYWGNGTNMAAIDSTATVTSYSKLTPSFPVGTFVRDLDVTPDGNYLRITVSYINSPNLVSTTQDTTQVSAASSYSFLWNGTDTGYTSYQTYGSYGITSNISFGPFEYLIGSDVGGTAIYTNSQKILSLPSVQPPNFGASFSFGNMLGFVSVENGQASIFAYGQYDNEYKKGLYRLYSQLAPTVGDKITSVPSALIVSNLIYGNSFSGYTNNQVGTSKMYFSVLQTTANGTAGYKLYKFNLAPTGQGTLDNTGTQVYETQQEIVYRLFRSIISNKVKIPAIRFYTTPLTSTNQAFTAYLIGSDGSTALDSKSFRPGTNVTSGADVHFWNPQITTTSALSLRIENSGTVNFVMIKIEVDYEEGGY